MNKEEKESIKSLKEFIYENGWMQVGKGKTILNLIDKQNKMIDFMADWISGSDAIFELPKNIATKEEIKQYFEELLKEE